MKAVPREIERRIAINISLRPGCELLSSQTTLHTPLSEHPLPEPDSGGECNIEDSSKMRWYGFLYLSSSQTNRSLQHQF